MQILLRSWAKEEKQYQSQIMEKKRTGYIKYLDTRNTYCFYVYWLNKFLPSQNESHRSQYHFKFRGIKKIIYLISIKMGYTKGSFQRDS